ncbi:peptidase inhibitor family I36 protein [Streptomyces sp. RerS4]|uniref:peptidase inhibitor family I36 protein n=1 Tax=Streptomyces sp. RerS4 TaxID=2942449 RepID=UPI00201BCE5A|nr:peptidase inhibitor family I36 protein [Streptomyces sp. RerS4]UQX00377.1 peptidase inhibitor family I36 protein [Streptomyces sp. RerS4]
MLLRRAAVAAFGAFTLLLAVPSSASAAVGEFQYTFVTPDGTPQRAVLNDPVSGECITLPEAADPGADPAHSPRNRTTSTATVFVEPDCSGDWFTLRPLTGRGSERLKLRSVVFS